MVCSGPAETLRQRRLWPQDSFAAKICFFFHFIDEKMLTKKLRKFVFNVFFQIYYIQHINILLR